MLSTVKVIVRSPANAAGATITEAIRARALKLVFMGRVSFCWSQARSSSGAM